MVHWSRTSPRPEHIQRRRHPGGGVRFVSRIRLGARLAARDLWRRSTETLLLLLALTVAATTLTIGLVLHGQTAAPYAETRNRTAGPDVVAALFPAPARTVTTADLRRLSAEAARPGVSARSRAFPTTWTTIEADGVRGVSQVQGRDIAPSAVDRPEVVSGRWLGGRGVVVERAFAQALGVRVGDNVLLGGRRVPVVGIAVSAALPPYPQLCTIGCILRPARLVLRSTRSGVDDPGRRLHWPLATSPSSGSGPEAPASGPRAGVRTCARQQRTPCRTT